MTDPQDIRCLSLRIYRSLCSRSWVYTRHANIRGLWKIDTRLPTFSTVCAFRRMAAPASGSLVLFIHYCLSDTVYPIFILFIYSVAIPYVYASFFSSTPCSYSRTGNHQIGSFSVPPFFSFIFLFFLVRLLSSLRQFRAQLSVKSCMAACFFSTRFARVAERKVEVRGTAF